MNGIGDRIIFLRESLDLSQVRLAEKIGITKMTLYKYEKNLCEPRSEVIANLADALDTTADYLTGRTSDPKPLEKSKDEIHLKKDIATIAKLRKLTPINRAKIEERIDMLLETQKQQ